MSDTFDSAIGRFLDAMDHADFFTAGHTYIQNKPYKAPELLDLFRCVHVATNPRNGEPRAFGFAKPSNAGDDAWYSTALGPSQWASKWVEVDTEKTEP